jgi:hypothetical protein
VVLAGIVAANGADYQNKQHDPSPFQKATVQSCSGVRWCGNHKLAHLIEIPCNQNSSGSANWHDNKFIMFESYKGPLYIL